MSGKNALRSSSDQSKRATIGVQLCSLSVLVLLCICPSESLAQSTLRDSVLAESISLQPGSLSPRPPQFVLREHATGGEVPLAVMALGFSGSVIVDIITAPRSARLYNERNLESPPKSGTTALLWSLGATGLPLMAGTVVAGDDGSGEGILIAAAGLIIGPSAGHWYARATKRAWITTGIRALLAVTGGVVWECCT